MVYGHCLGQEQSVHRMWAAAEFLNLPRSLWLRESPGGESCLLLRAASGARPN